MLLIFEGGGDDTIRLETCKKITFLLSSTDSAKAEAYIQKGLALSRKLADNESEVFFESERARIFMEHHHLDEAINLCELILNQNKKERFLSASINCYQILGKLYLLKGDYSQAKSYLEKVIDNQKPEEISEQYIRNLSNLGIAYERSGNPQDALPILKRSLALAQGLNDNKGIASNLKHIGTVHSSLGNLDSALHYLEKSLGLERALNNRSATAGCLQEIGTIYSQMGQNLLAISYYDKALQINRQIDDNEEIAGLLISMGGNFIYAGNFDQAIIHLESAAKSAKSLGNKQLAAKAIINLASVHALQGNTEKGIKYLKEGLVLMEDLGDKKGLIIVNNNLGYTYKKLGDYRLALSYYKKSVHHNDSIDLLILSKTLSNIGFCYLQGLQNEDSAFYYLDRANEIYQSAGNNYRLKENFQEIGSWYTSQGHISNAIQYYYKALDIAKETNDTSGIASIYDDLAGVNESQRNWKEGISYQLKALQMYELISDKPGIANSQVSLANFFIQKKDFDQAITYSNMALKNAMVMKDSCQFSGSYLVMGKAYSKLQHLDSAIFYLNKACLQAEKCQLEINAAQAYTELGNIYSSQSKPEKAFTTYQTALKLAESSHDRQSIQEAAAYLFPIYQQRGQYKQAYETLNLYQANRDSLFNIENTRKLVQKEMEIAYAKAEQEKELQQQKEDALKNSQLERQQWIIYTSLGAFVAMLIIALTFLRNYKNKQKANIILQRQKKELEELDQSKSRLFANISHELRTPLTLIYSPIASLISNRQNYDHKTIQKLELVNRNSQQLKSLVDDILDLSKLESNKIELHEKPTLLEPFLSKIFSNFESLASHLSIKYSAKHSGLTGKWAMIDPSKVEKVVNNLLSNAIKHTPSGGEVQLNASITDDKIVLAVSDTGNGIAKADLPHIFDRFFQSKQPDAPIQGGTGIGLALAKELIHLMNGDIQVESELSKGSKFTVSLPYQVAEAETVKEFAEEELTEAINLDHLLLDEIETVEKKFHVLVVEDHPDMQQFLHGLLQTRYHLHLASNGKKALDILSKQKVDLIVSDVMMPEMDGYTLLGNLKNDDQFKNIPVIMLTALDTQENRLNALTLGVDDYLTKPFAPEELLARVYNLLQRYESRIEAAAIVDDDALTEEESLVSFFPSDQKEDTSPAERVNDQEWLQQIVDTIKSSLENPDFQVKDLANKFHMSERQFYRKMKQVTGMTPWKYQQEVALQKARYLLENKQYGNVSAICFSIGMSNVSRFSKMYQARFGKKPKAYFSEVVR